MTLLYYDPLFLEHHPSDAHPEHPNRLRSAWKALMDRGISDRCQRGVIRSATQDELLAIHDKDMIHFARETCERGGGYLEADTPVSTRSYAAALQAAGACLSAVDAVLRGDDANAFCLIRPPGHHATPTHSMGFCLFNNIALAALHALEIHRLNRVLIVDWDVHHGNGTQDVFYEDPRVMFLSSHRYPFYPGSGRESETGSGPGLGFTRNVPLAADTPTRDILDRFASALDDCARRIRPELVLLSAGFDAHHRDPIGGLNLDTEHFRLFLDMVLAVATEHGRGRLVSILEGGYNVEVLANCVCEHVERLWTSSTDQG